MLRALMLCLCICTALAARGQTVSPEDLVRESQKRQAEARDRALSAIEGSQPLDVDRGLELRGVEIEDAVQDPALYIFVSFSMPDHMLSEYIAEAEKYRGRVIVRGVKDGSFKATTHLVQSLINGAGEIGGVAIDPKPFETFGVKQVPVIILADRALERCFSPECLQQVPRHDRISGSVSIEYALEQFSRRGDLAAQAQALYRAGQGEN